MLQYYFIYSKTVKPPTHNQTVVHYSKYKEKNIPEGLYKISYHTQSSFELVY
jgi:hypothetical protein